MKLLFSILIVFLFATPINAQTITGKVISVADGDTITILSNNNQQTKIRLYGIDTPEKAQAYGKKAKKFTASLTAGKQVKVKIYDIDKYGRSVGVVFVNGVNVNEQLIENGFAWQYRKYCKASFCKNWLKKEKQAQSFYFGLWKDNKPQPPWEWRKTKKRGKRKQVKKQNSFNNLGVYHGNKKSHVYHSSTCEYYFCKNCTVSFQTITQANNAGYRPHSQCVQGGNTQKSYNDKFTQSSVRNNIYSTQSFGTYHGNKKSHVYHSAGCRHYNCKNCVITFHSKSEAESAGFRPCRNCIGYR